MHVVKAKSVIKLHNHVIICTRQEELGKEARFPKVNTTVHCSTYSQLNNTHDHMDIPLKQSMVSLMMVIRSLHTHIQHE